jgi:hypothetical protein
VLTIGQTFELLGIYFTFQAPLLSQPAVPLAAHTIVLGVVVVFRIGELLPVIAGGLAGRERFGDGQHTRLIVFKN